VLAAEQILGVAPTGKFFTVTVICDAFTKKELRRKIDNKTVAKLDSQWLKMRIEATKSTTEASKISKLPNPGLRAGYEIDKMTSRLDRDIDRTTQGVEDAPKTNLD